MIVIQQQITINVTEAGGGGTPLTPPNTGFWSGIADAIGNAASNHLALIISLILLTALIVTGIILYRQRKEKGSNLSLRARCGSNPARLTIWSVVLMALLAGVATLFTPIVNADTDLTLTANGDNLELNIVKGEATTATANSVTTVNTANVYGYTVTAELSTALAEIDLTLTGPTDETAAPLTLTTTAQTVKATATAATDDETQFTLTATVPTDLAVGTYTTNITYDATDNPEPPQSGTICESANAASACQVDIDANMIPITRNSTNDAWQVADPTVQGDWYNYSNQKWANAVTVSSTSLATYQNQPGVTIAEADVLGYWAYIPRYTYQVQRFAPSDPPITTPTAFNIEFQIATNTKYLPLETGDWATHPAFTFGATELNGIWVGKFETGSGTVAGGADATAYATNNATHAELIRPNIFSRRTQTVFNQFTASQSLKTLHNLADPTSSDTRQAKNADWGAVTYLATSAYGAGAGQAATATDGKVGKNANSNYVTGCGRATLGSDDGTYAGGLTCTNTSGTNPNINKSYYTEYGLESSTTNTIYGVYDMSGGAYDRTLTNFNGAIGSGGFFAALPDTKYLNTYTNPPFNGTNYTNYNLCTWATCGGQANYETTTVQSVSGSNQSWFGDSSSFVNSSGPWANRGSYYDGTTNAGLFNSGNNTGAFAGAIGWRAVLSLQ